MPGGAYVGMPAKKPDLQGPKTEDNLALDPTSNLGHPKNGLWARIHRRRGEREGV